MLASVYFLLTSSWQDQKQLLTESMKTQYLAASLAVSRVLATPGTLFVASYSGAVSTLLLDDAEGGQYTLTNTSVNLGCSPDPSWLQLDKPTNTLYCIGEGLATPNGSLSSYEINADGSLTQKAKADTPGGPVYGTLYGSAQGAIALPHYSVGAVSSFSVNPDATTLTFQQNISFPPPPPPPANDPDRERQLTPHPHEAILDPTSEYVLVPDLGSDLVRVFTFDEDTLQLREVGEQLQAAPRSGPRHAAFYVTKDKTYLYLLTELSAQLFSYEITYLPEGAGLSFNEIYVSDTLGGATSPGRVAPAEIRLSPDSRFVVVSNRNDSSFSLPSSDPANATEITSDSLATFKVEDDGTLEFVQLAPSGGRYPRSYDINKAGAKVAVGLQNDGRVVVLGRDVETGLIGDVLAGFGGPDPDEVGQVTRVVWNE